MTGWHSAIGGGDTVFLTREAFVAQATQSNATVVLRKVVERDHEGQLFNAVIYVAAGALILHLVVDLDWTFRFIIGAVFFIAVAVMAMLDVVFMKSVHYFWVEAHVDGRLVAYATPCLADAQEIVRALGLGHDVMSGLQSASA